MGDNNKEGASSSFREKVAERRKAFTEKTEKVLGKTPGNSKVSWGFILLVATAAFALYNIVDVIVTFIKY